MAQKYDVVIVGAGPSGMLAAKAAGQAGLNVALLDRKTDLTHLERMCGQTLVSMNDYYFGELISYNRTGKRIAFMKNGFSFGYDGPVKNLFGWQIFSPNGNRIPFGLPEETRKKGDFGIVGIAYDKEKLFRCLLDEVEEAGVHVFSGIDVTGVTSSSDGVNVTGSGQSFDGSYLIAADGTNSRITRMAGFNKERTFYCYLLTKGWYMRNLKLPDPDILISSIAFKSPAPGFMFIFPRAYENEWTVVFLSLDPRVNLDDVVDYFVKENPFYAAWFQGAERKQQYASSQYIYSPIPSPYKDRILLAGDTGACQELENSGAMISGWKAGNAVAAAVKEDKAGIESSGISDYLAWWASAYTEGYRHEDYLMNFALPYVIDNGDDLDYICSLVKDPLPPCWNPYAATGYLGQLIQGLVPTIQKERPEIMQKLAKMAQPMTDVLQSATEACLPIEDLD